MIERKRPRRKMEGRKMEKMIEIKNGRKKERRKDIQRKIFQHLKKSAGHGSQKISVPNSQKARHWYADTL